MPIQLLPTAPNFFWKQLSKTVGKKAFSGATRIDLGITPLNGNEDETVNLLREYQNPNSPMAQNVSEIVTFFGIISVFELFYRCGEL